MTAQQNNILINMMLNGELVFDLSADDDQIMIRAYLKNRMRWIFIDGAGVEVERISE